MRRVEEFVAEAAEKKSHQAAFVLVTFVVFGAMDFAVERMITATQLPLRTHGLIDGAIVGSFAGFTTLLLIEAARRRRTRLRRELQESARLNHEIRNALEVIAQAGYLVDDVVYGRAIAESVERIRNTLTRA